jgi:hypothetical protein
MTPSLPCKSAVQCPVAAALASNRAGMLRQMSCEGNSHEHVEFGAAGGVTACLAAGFAGGVHMTGSSSCLCSMVHWDACGAWSGTVRQCAVHVHLQGAVRCR